MLLAESLLGSSSAGESVFIEDVFSTWLYTGNGSTQTINNGIDLAGKGGLVWIKNRNATFSHNLYDTARGVQNYLMSNANNAQINRIGSVTSFNSNGFTMGGWDEINNSPSEIYASWTFREQPKFFDIVTYTGNGITGRQIPHNLQVSSSSQVGCVIVKRTDTSSNWMVYSRGMNNSMFLNSTNADVGSNTANGYAVPQTATTFTVYDGSSGIDAVNASGGTYVAYLFAHNAGGFGATGADNVISCGSFTTNADGVATVNLGYEPQWVLMKRTDSAGSWTIFDNMRGWSSSQSQLFPNNSNAEGVGGPLEILQATGFATKAFSFASNATVIYIAIRRGPMRTPTSGTSVFAPTTSTWPNPITIGFPTDMMMMNIRGGNATYNTFVSDRLRGSSPYLVSSNTAAEQSISDVISYDQQNSLRQGLTSSSSVLYALRRAPGFFDVVCYTGTGAINKTKNHNLGVVPELMIIKNRGPAGFNQNWAVYPGPLGTDKFMFLNTNAAAGTFGAYWDDTPPTSTTFSVGNYQDTNASTLTYVAYLFASCPGVSKVGSYTGTGNTQTINCGFSSGARFVLIKRTDSTGDWYVWDSARGIVAGNDPYLLLNSTAAEVTNTDWVDTAASGFELSNAGGNLVNINGASYIFLAIA